MSKVSKKKQRIIVNDEIFSREWCTDPFDGLYSLYVTMRMRDGFFNITDICQQLRVNWEEIKRNNIGEHHLVTMYELKEGYPKEVQGTYANPAVSTYLMTTHSPKMKDALKLAKILGLPTQ